MADQDESFIIIHDMRNKRATIIGGTKKLREEFARKFLESYGFPVPIVTEKSQ